MECTKITLHGSIAVSHVNYLKTRKVAINDVLPLKATRCHCQRKKNF